MNNLRLIPDVYRLQPLINANFSFGKYVSAILPTQKGGCWSQILRSWYFPKISKKRGLLKTYDIKDISEPGSERK
jgi:hypothetical protein